MINFVKNFNTEKANLGFFVSEESNFSNLDKIDLNLKKTISQFLNNHKKTSEGKKIFSLDLSIKQKIFLYILLSIILFFNSFSSLILNTYPILLVLFFLLNDASAIDSIDGVMTALNSIHLDFSFTYIIHFLIL